MTFEFSLPKNLSPLLACLLAVAACGGSKNIPPPSSPTSEVASDEISKYRGKLAELRAHARAKEAVGELEKASDWLETAKTVGASDPDSRRVRLLLDAVKAQLVLAQSLFARRDAEDAAGIGSGKTPGTPAAAGAAGASDEDGKDSEP